jgi:hypothetical protein
VFSYFNVRFGKSGRKDRGLNSLRTIKQIKIGNPPGFTAGLAVVKRFLNASLYSGSKILTLPEKQALAGNPPMANTVPFSGYQNLGL